MFPALVAALLAAAAQSDTVFTVDGGRISGTVVEESATVGVTIQTPDGAIRRLDRGQVSRIEYADGTVSTPRPATPPAAAPAPAPKPQEKLDTIYFLGGGRARGTVIEENPKAGVRVKLLDGSIQTFRREDLVRIEYADGSVSWRTVPTAPPQSVAAPPPAKVEEKKPELVPFYVAGGIGITFLDGDIAKGQSMSSVFSSQQAHVAGEVGLRLSPAWALGAYGDVGGGDPSQTVRDTCTAQGNNCSAVAGRVGVLLRHTWDPFSSRPVWLSLGTGWEFGGVTIDQHGANGSSGSGMKDLVTYTGREFVRLGAGIDFRPNQILGFGLYGSVAVGAYDTVKDSAGVTTSLDRANHTTAQVGIRLILFP